MKSLWMILGILSILVAFSLFWNLGDSSLILWEIRFPRLLLAFAVGASLSVAGAILQTVFNNPLCEPYTLGISSGATLGAAISSTLGLTFAWMGIASSSFIGALIFTFILLMIASKYHFSTISLLLSGVMLGFLGSSLVALWMATADSQGIQGAIFWLLGDLSRARLLGSLVVFALSNLLMIYIFSHHKKLDTLLLGSTGAQSLGTDPVSLRNKMVITTSVLVACAVSSAGMIGFVGLIVPHLVRAQKGSLHRSVIPYAALIGGLSVIGSDFLARTIIAPQEIPVGVITALIGSPLFIWSALKTSRRFTE